MIFQGYEVVAVLLVLPQVAHPIRLLLVPCELLVLPQVAYPIRLLLVPCELSAADDGAFMWRSRLY